ncbi:MAG: hypothetical protein IK065_06185 [Neisseriaceae bacterium]|nr:hypothetical protein [Neisseriaceae bacterium]
MKKYLAFTFLTIILSACATKQTQPPKPSVQFDTIQEVVYQCDSQSNSQKILVTYAISEEEIVAAQIRTKNKTTPILIRNKNITQNNTFIGGDNNRFTWITESATPANLERTKANMLTEKTNDTINGKHTVVDKVLFKHCVIDKKATNKINPQRTKNKTKKNNKKSAGK